MKKALLLGQAIKGVVELYLAGGSRTIRITWPTRG